MKVSLTTPAKADLVEVGDWIAKDSPANALRFVDKLSEACVDLGALPERYPIHEPSGVRRRPIGAYLILYRVTDDVQILRIIHAARDWEALLGEV